MATENLSGKPVWWMWGISHQSLGRVSELSVYAQQTQCVSDGHPPTSTHIWHRGLLWHYGPYHPVLGDRWDIRARLAQKGSWKGSWFETRKMTELENGAFTDAVFLYLI